MTPATRLTTERADTDDPILTVEEAARLIRMEPKWLQRSTCPRLRVGKYSRYQRGVVLAWFLAQSEEAA